MATGDTFVRTMNNGRCVLFLGIDEDILLGMTPTRPSSSSRGVAIHASQLCDRADVLMC
jgi:hypothetical protein